MSIIETQTPLPPTTTLAEDKVVAGQRKINIVWEYTQAFITILITGAIVYTAITQKPSEVLTNAFFLIIGFYFSRTNHANIGGIGTKATDREKYVGR
jgi:hypothetical protein